jgi:hypothetical protein
VLASPHRAARPGGLLYLTVEEVAAPVIEDAVATLIQRGLPALRGEVIDGNTGGYHHYPGRDQATAGSGLHILDQGY